MIPRETNQWNPLGNTDWAPVMAGEGKWHPDYPDTLSRIGFFASLAQRL